MNIVGETPRRFPDTYNRISYLYCDILFWIPFRACNRRLNNFSRPRLTHIDELICLTYFVGIQPEMIQL